MFGQGDQEFRIPLPLTDSPVAMDKYLDSEESEKIVNAFRNSRKSLMLLDYDGTLVPFHCEPSEALPGKFLLKLLQDLSKIPDLDLAIISGRHRDFLESIFKDLKATLFGEHGAVFRVEGQWDALENDDSWQEDIVKIITEAVKSTPGSNIERKESSIVWHYRKANEELAEKRIPHLIKKLTPFCNRNNLTIMKGRKIVEVKPSEYTKGTAIMNFFDCSNYDFILAAGDDTTDEDLFEALPQSAITIHIGTSSDISSYTLKTSNDFVNFLSLMRKGKAISP